MDFASIFTIISVIIAVSALILSIMIWAFTKLDSIAQKLDGDIKSLANKIDSDSKSHSQRTDQLYMMFIDLLRNNNIKINP